MKLPRNFNQSQSMHIPQVFQKKNKDENVNCKETILHDNKTIIDTPSKISSESKIIPIDNNDNQIKPFPTS